MRSIPGTVASARDWLAQHQYYLFDDAVAQAFVSLFGIPMHVSIEGETGTGKTALARILAGTAPVSSVLRLDAPVNPDETTR
jgi:MoxR-like ATPase